MKGRKILHSKIHQSGQFRIANSEFRISIAIFVVLCINLLLAPVVYAAVDGTLERKSAYAIALLGLVTLGLVVYLFVVVFQPERF